MYKKSKIKSRRVVCVIDTGVEITMTNDIVKRYIKLSCLVIRRIRDREKNRVIVFQLKYKREPAALEFL